MSIWDICIRRPVFTAMLVSAPIVLGLASYLRLGVELFPNVDIPMVTVTTTLRGASINEMETGVTKPIEDAVNTISGIDELRSSTKEGISTVVVAFKLEKNGDVGAQEVDAKVRTILTQLPVGTDPPIIDKLAVDAAPVVTIVVSGRRDFREVTEIARKKLKEDLETLPGVGSVVLIGGRQRAVHVTLDPDKLQKYESLTVEDVRQALVRENREDPGGRVDRRQSEVGVRVLGRVERTEFFNKLIIANRNGQPVRIEDVGRAEEGIEEPRGISRLWAAGESPDDEPGQNAVSLVVQKQSGRNTVEVVDTVRKRLAELQPTLPPDIRTEVIRDQSRFIKNSMDEVKKHLFMAVVLVSLSVLLFLRDWRTTLIAALAIPTSLIGAFAFMDLMGFTLNSFTMIGLILAVGIVVDDAVVVLENIFRHMEEKGLTAWQAASSATREIALAVLATTLSLVVVFAPVAFMGGQVGRFFNAFGWVVGFCVMMSMARVVHHDAGVMRTVSKKAVTPAGARRAKRERRVGLREAQHQIRPHLASDGGNLPRHARLVAATPLDRRRHFHPDRPQHASPDRHCRIRFRPQGRPERVRGFDRLARRVFARTSRRGVHRHRPPLAQAPRRDAHARDHRRHDRPRNTRTGRGDPRDDLCPPHRPA